MTEIFCISIWFVISVGKEVWLTSKNKDFTNTHKSHGDKLRCKYDVFAMPQNGLIKAI